MPRAKSKESEAVARIRAICLALPEAEEKPFGGHIAPSFRVRDKLFCMTSEPGWVGVRLDKPIDWRIVEELVRDSYRMIAPKKLASLVTPEA
jgi:predicted DNA-binding protein (MmcQ/YjbR family)